MNVEEARAELHRAAALLNVDQSIDVSDPVRARAALHQIIHAYAERPIFVARTLLQTLDVLTGPEAAPETRFEVVKTFEKWVRTNAESVLFLSTEGFEEGAWFRASDLIEATSFYLDVLKIAMTPAPLPAHDG